MASTYGDIESAIATAIGAEEDNPFKTVLVHGSQLTNQQLAEELDKLSNANTAPAVMIMWRGSQEDPQHAGWRVELGQFWCVCVQAARTAEAVLRGDDESTGVYELAEWLVDTLHNQDISDVPNRLYLRRSMPVPRDLPVTVAAWVVVFETQVRDQD